MRGPPTTYERVTDQHGFLSMLIRAAGLAAWLAFGAASILATAIGVLPRYYQALRVSDGALFLAGIAPTSKTS